MVQRRKLHGDNDFSVKEETPLWQRYLEQVSERCACDITNCCVYVCACACVCVYIFAYTHVIDLVLGLMEVTLSHYLKIPLLF